MNCLIIDDEPMAVGILEDYINDIPGLNLVAKCSMAMEAYNIMHQNKVDLLFLDINMPKVNGINFIKSLNHPPIIVFTTAFSEFALDAFNLNATDYLLKPFSFERFLSAVSKASEIHSLRNRNVNIPAAINDSSDDKPEKGYIIVKSGYQSVKINLNEILFIEGLKDYVKIFIVNQSRSIITHLTLKKMSEVLPESFTRIHKSYIISIPNIDSVTKAQVIYGEKRIPIGRSFKDRFFTRLNYTSISV